MDKGIRSGVNFKFNDLLPQLTALGGKTFRRTILDWTVEEYGCTMAAASTHYNYAFQACKKASPELVAGLGRADDKNNGGRKKKAVEVAAPAGTLISTGIKPNTSTHTVSINPAAEAPTEQQTEFTVKIKKTGAVVAAGLSFEDARALVAKAAAAKKAKLYWI